MDNEKALAYLIVSGKLDIKAYDDRNLDKGRFKLLLNNDNLWNLRETIDYTKKICDICNIQDTKRILSVCIMNELGGNCMFSKTVYNTLKFDLEGWCEDSGLDLGAVWDDIHNIILYMMYTKHAMTLLEDIGPNAIYDEIDNGWYIETRTMTNLRLYWTSFVNRLTNKRIEEKDYCTSTFNLLRFDKDNDIELDRVSIYDLSKLKRNEWFVMF